jgi:hypothetical protein
MDKQWKASLLAAASLMASAACGHAQSSTPGAPRNGAGQASAGGFYVSVDSSFQAINLPNYGVGLVRADHFTGNAIGPLDTFKARASRIGVDAAAGYVFRNGTLAPLLGSNVRVELGGAHISADASKHATGFVDGTSPAHDALAYQMLSGFVNSGLGCFGPCNYSTSLTTDYAATELKLRATSDFRFSSVTLSPSLEVFAGRVRNDQSLTTMLDFGTSPVYHADTSLRWTDWGARLGVQGKLDVTPWLAFGLGGKIGFASRDVGFSGSDVQTNSFGIVEATSTISRRADTTAFLANLEASLTARAAPNIVVRAFTGLNFDSHVPGIAPATYAGSYTPPRQETPAGITFSGETSYYAGLGVILSLGP